MVQIDDQNEESIKKVSHKMIEDEFNRPSLGTSRHIHSSTLYPCHHLIETLSCIRALVGCSAYALPHFCACIEHHRELVNLIPTLFEILKGWHGEHISDVFEAVHAGQFGHQRMQLTGDGDGIDNWRHPHKNTGDILVRNGFREWLDISVYRARAESHVNGAQAPAMLYEVYESYEGERWRDEPTTSTSEVEFLEQRSGLRHYLE